MRHKKWALGIAGAMAGTMLFGNVSQAAPYTVKTGDSLWKIATAHQISTTQLKTMNQLTGDWIYPGQVLQVPGATTYTVQNGETMWLISVKFQISLDALLKANPQLSNPNNIWAGLQIQLPVGAQTGNTAVNRPARFADGFFPLAKGTYEPMTNNYGEGRDWTSGGTAQRSHEGIDIFANEGTKVYSAMDGEVINYGWSELGGWRLTVRVDGSTAFYYAHLSRYADGIGKGSKVKKGQLIGYVGSTGYGPEGTSGLFLPHLHFGIYQTSPWTAIDATSYLRWWEANR
ncbi:LysM peptidoglycan-binding domain-containing protein [Paenibacillus macerans]|uniref:M23 family metallopeptidase n=1 Tax=Paenibacillus macerans TaxID=44252 RepID=UPI003D30F483